MMSIADFFNNLFSALSALSFTALVIILCCSAGGIFIAALILCALSPKVRGVSKRPFFHLCNLFSALSLAVFAGELELPEAIAATAMFWCVCYLMYGALCLFDRPKQKQPETKVVYSALPPANFSPDAPVNIPAAKSSVRLEHALSIADKLLLKNLAKGDRQELERMKTTLSILQIKGALTPQEGGILNDNFNALLKLMAKYNL